MPAILSVPSAKAVNLIGKDQAARVTNNGSGTLYVGGPDVTTTTYDFSIATTASRNVSGPKWAVGSVESPIVLSDLPIGAEQNRLTQPRHWLRAPQATSTGTDTTVTANRAYVAEINLQNRVTLTGIGFLIGGTGGTHKAIAVLYDRDGNVLANSAKAGVTVSTANTYQDLPFESPVEVTTPGRYFVSIIYSGTTPTLRTALVDGVIGGTVNSAADFSAAPTAITVPTTAAAVNTTPQGLYVY